MKPKSIYFLNCPLGIEILHYSMKDFVEETKKYGEDDLGKLMPGTYTSDKVLNNNIPHW